MVDRRTDDRSADTGTEAASLYWQLTKTSPGQYRADHARALSNLSVRYRRLGQPARAVAQARTSVGIYQVLAAIRPDQYRAKLALGLSNLAKALEASGQKASAKKARAEAEQLSEPQRGSPAKKEP